MTFQLPPIMTPEQWEESARKFPNAVALIDQDQLVKDMSRHIAAKTRDAINDVLTLVDEPAVAAGISLAAIDVTVHTTIRHFVDAAIADNVRVEPKVITDMVLMLVKDRVMALMAQVEPMIREKIARETTT